LLLGVDAFLLVALVLHGPLDVLERLAGEERLVEHVEDVDVHPGVHGHAVGRAVHARARGAHLFTGHALFLLEHPRWAPGHSAGPRCPPTRTHHPHRSPPPTPWCRTCRRSARTPWSCRAPWRRPRRAPPSRRSSATRGAPRPDGAAPRGTAPRR